MTDADTEGRIEHVARTSAAREDFDFDAISIVSKDDGSVFVFCYLRFCGEKCGVRCRFSLEDMGKGGADLIDYMGIRLAKTMRKLKAQRCL